MEFRYPAFFLLLLLLPPVFFWAKRREKLEFAFPSFELFQNRPTTPRMVLFSVLPFLRALVFVLVITALARPANVSSSKEYQTHGVDIMIALDISGSMLAEDFQPENRIFVAKQEAAKFIQGRENDRIGLVVFSKKAFTQCPLTLDYRILTELLSEIRVGMIADGTAIGMGIATAVN
ncbi:MAG: VWA domain-containing protein, partial [Candidatus Omnitrophica bacterium]|nr:VWA domain-containing protein [Candidatus Omnitrophota bacterium]